MAEQHFIEVQPQKIGPRVVRLEHLTWSRQYAHAIDALLEVLDDFDSDHGDFTYWCIVTEDESLVEILFTRLASVITTLLSDESFKISRRHYERLVPHIPSLGYIFYLSGFRSADHVLAAVIQRAPASKAGRIGFADTSDARRFLLGCSIYSRHTGRLIDLVERDPQAIAAPLLSALSADIAAEPLALRNRHRLLGALARLVDVTPQHHIILRMTGIWALCSYASTSDRHDAKKHINRMIRNLLVDRGLATREEVHGERSSQLQESGKAAIAVQPTRTVATASDRSKPMLVVASEVTRATHVMHRCYVRFLTQLRQRFHVVAMVTEEDLAQGPVPWADQTRAFRRDQLQLDVPLRIMRDLKPDVIYYPSLGMQVWTIVAASVRLAPLQVATLGHPATTQSPEIDCVVAGSHMLGQRNCFSESVVLLACPGNMYDLRTDVEPVVADVRQHADPLRVAIVASTMKLNAEFVAACRRIADAVDRRIEFHVFPNSIGLRHAVVHTQLKRLLVGHKVKVYPRTDFETYIDNLNTCDVSLSPFPFGGENSVLDALLQRIPVVSLEGDQPHARLDSRVLNLAAAPPWLITRSADEYEATARCIMSDDSLRCEVSQQLDPAKIQEAIREEHETYATDFIDTMWWVYRNQDLVKADRARVWRADDRKRRKSQITN